VAVFEHTYGPFEGQLTPQRSRFLVIPRHAYRIVFKSKLFTGLYVLSFVCPLVMAVLIYLHYNANALTLLDVQPRDLLPINNVFFRAFTSIQSSFAFVLAVLIGPALVSRDLTNNALPLYLSRPLSRFEYLLGKGSVLVIMLSLITWVPGLLLFAFQSYLEGFGWFRYNLWIANAIFFSCVLWIVLLTLVSLALSAWIKWRIAASGALFATFVIPTAVATMISALFRTPWSHLFSPSMLMQVVTDHLYRFDNSLDLDTSMVLPAWAGWFGLIGTFGFCIWMLTRKVKAYEVVS
jgi:ABC-2 type transport system permease protein